MPLPALAGVALRHSLDGLAFGVAIPASLGGAVVDAEAADGVLVEDEPEARAPGQGDRPVAGGQAFGQESLEVVDVLFEAEPLHGEAVRGRGREVHVQVGVPVGRDGDVEHLARRGRPAATP